MIGLGTFPKIPEVSVQAREFASNRLTGCGVGAAPTAGR